MMASSALTAVVEGGEIVLALAWAGGVTVRGLIVSHNDKALKKEREGVQKAALKTIETTDLPKLFDKDFKASILTAETLDSIITATPQYTNKFLDQYVRHIMNALGYLYELHAERITNGKKLDDITSSVLCWMILNIGQKCVDVVEYDKVFGYLQRISAFATEFASIKGEDSRRFIGLTRVVSELDKAACLLKDHSLSLSLTERVKYLLVVTGKAASGLLTACTKLIVPNNHWKYLLAFIPERLAQGILRFHSVFKNFFGLVPHEVPLIKLPKSKLASYLQISAKDYLRALDLDGESDKGDFINPAKFNVTGINTEELKQAFTGCKNFLTLKASLGDGTNAVNKLVPVQSEDLQNRVSFYVQLMELLHCVNVLRYFGRHLRDRLIELGERYFDSPEETVYMFSVIKAFGTYISEGTDRAVLSLAEIKAQQENAMMPAGIGNDLYTEINQRLADIKSEVCPAINQLVDIHNTRLSNSQGKEHKQDKTIPVKIDKNDPLLQIPNIIKKKFNLAVNQSVLEGAEVQPPAEASEEDALYNNMSELGARIQALADANDRRVDQYREVYLALLLLFIHSLKMSMEKHAQRIDKSHQMKRLLLTQCLEFNSFLNKSPIRRQTDTHTLVDSITNIVKDPASKFLDVHDNHDSSWVVGFFKNTFLNTQSRKQANVLVEACKKLLVVR